MLWNINGAPGGYPDHGFSDVPTWVDPAVRWITAEGHATGYPDGTYRPNNNITRAQTTRMLWNINGAPGGYPDHGFSDVPTWVDPAVRWITAEGHATGYPDGTYRPDDNITRAQTTRMLWNLHDVKEDPLTAVERTAALELFTDVPRTEHQSVPEWLVDWKAHDLATLLLSLPRFQHR